MLHRRRSRPQGGLRSTALGGRCFLVMCALWCGLVSLVMLCVLQEPECGGVIGRQAPAATSPPRQRRRSNTDRAAIGRETAPTTAIGRETAAIERETTAIERETTAIERETAAIERETTATERETAAIGREMAATDSDRARFGTGTTRDRRDVALRSTRAEIDRDARSAWSVWSVWTVPPLCKIPNTYPSKPKQGQGAAAQQRYEELVEMFEGKFNIKGKWQLEAKSQLAYALLHEAVSKNPKLSGLIDY